jgi:hypothetical protein
MNMNDDEKQALAALYAKWETASLTDAVTRRSGEYAPQAIELMVQELAKRAGPTHETESLKTERIRTPSPNVRSIRLAGSQTVSGAWMSGLVESPGRHIFGQIGLVFGLPYFLYTLFALTFTSRCFGKETLALPIGFCLSLAGYALIRQDRCLQYFALGVSAAMACWAGVMQSPMSHDKSFNLLGPAAYSVVCVVVGRKQKATQPNSAGDVATHASPEK